VVKVVPDMAPGSAERQFQAGVDLDDILIAVPRVRAIRPLAWSDDPPSLVTAYVESDDLVSLLREPEHDAWKSGNLATWVEAAGSALAAYHAQPVGDIEPAAEEVRRVGARTRVDADEIERVLTAADWRARARRRYGDFGPGNFQGAPDGTLYLLDPPDQVEISVAHRDIANFLFETRRQLAGRGYTRSAPVKGRFPGLRDRFLAGYGMEPTPGDAALIALFEVRRASAMARKRFPKRSGDAAWFARLALARSRDLKRALNRLG
jgi:hypothetical protein